MKAEDYFEIIDLIVKNKKSIKYNRIFGIKNKIFISTSKPIVVLKKWISELDKEKNSNSVANHYDITIMKFLSIILFIIGFIIGKGILSYDGNEPVNIINVINIVIFLPLLSIIFSIIIFIANVNIFNYIKSFIPIYWLNYGLNKIFRKLIIKKKKNDYANIIPDNIKKLILLRKIQFVSIFFTFGLFLSFILIIIIQDVAFTWSTTLNITSSEFYVFLDILSIPWSFLVGNLVPSIELIDASRYYHLGKIINKDILNNVSEIGVWWKFLSMSIIFYSILLRILFFFIIDFILKIKLKKYIFSIKEIQTILYEMKTPIVSRRSLEKIDLVKNNSSEDINLVKDNIKLDYQYTLGLNFSINEIIILNEKFNIKSLKNIYIGNNNSIKQDIDIIEKLEKIILIYVKSWEPPIMDFIDLLEIAQKNIKIININIHLISDNFISKKIEDENIEIWNSKINILSSNKIFLIRDFKK